MLLKEFYRDLSQNEVDRNEKLSYQRKKKIQ